MNREEQIRNANPYSGSSDIGFGKMVGFNAGAEWADKNPASPWIKTSERLPIPIIEMVDGEEYGSVFVIGRTSKYESPDLHSYYGYNGNYKWEDGRVPEYWMPIPKLS